MGSGLFTICTEADIFVQCWLGPNRCCHGCPELPQLFEGWQCYVGAVRARKSNLHHITRPASNVCHDPDCRLRNSSTDRQFLELPAAYHSTHRTRDCVYRRNGRTEFRGSLSRNTSSQPRSKESYTTKGSQESSISPKFRQSHNGDSRWRFAKHRRRVRSPVTERRIGSRS